MTRGKAGQDGKLKKGDRQDISTVMTGGQAGELDNYARGTGKRLDISERGEGRTDEKLRQDRGKDQAIRVGGDRTNP